MDDVNPMRDRKARDALRERVMDGLASGIEKGAIRHSLVLALLDLADEGETASASADAYHEEMITLRNERDATLEAESVARSNGDAARRERDLARCERNTLKLERDEVRKALAECVNGLRHVCDGCWQPEIIARAEALLLVQDSSEDRRTVGPPSGVRVSRDQLEEAVVRLTVERDEARSSYREEIEATARKVALAVADAVAADLRDTVSRERALRAVEAAYRLGAKDAQRLCAGVAGGEVASFDRGSSLEPSETASRLGITLVEYSCMLGFSRATAIRVMKNILELDPTRAMPALDGMLDEPGKPCPTCCGRTICQCGKPYAECEVCYSSVECPDCGGQGLTPSADGPEPGDPIVECHCPCCGAGIEITHGDDEGEISVVGTPAAIKEEP